MTRDKIEKFCERFNDENDFGLGQVYYELVYEKDGELDMHLSSAQYHSSYQLIGKKSRAQIIEGLCKHFGL